VRGFSNYPPGVTDYSPDAPWNQPEVVASCACCDCELLSDGRVVDSWGDEVNACMDEGDDVCDDCFAALEEVSKNGKCKHCGRTLEVWIEMTGHGDYYRVEWDDNKCRLNWHKDGECL